MNNNYFKKWGFTLIAILAINITANADVALNKRAMQPIDATVAPNAAASSAAQTALPADAALNPMITPVDKAVLPAGKALKPMATPADKAVLPADKALKPMANPAGTALKPIGNSAVQPSATGALPKMTVPGAIGAGTALKSIDMRGNVNFQDLVNQPDNTVIENNGQRGTVGELKARLRQKLSEKAPAPDMTKKSGLLPAKKSSIPATILVPQKKSIGTTSAVSIATVKEAGAMAEAMKSCAEVTPVIRRIEGDFTPNSVVTIKGGCLGDTAGELRWYGPFPNGYTLLKAFQWDSGKIITQIPGDIRGVRDGKMKLEAVRADRKTSNGLNVDFWAARELIDVSNYWHPQNCNGYSGQWSRLECRENGLDARVIRLLAGGVGSAFVNSLIDTDSKNSVNWKIELNDQCVLQEAWEGHSRGVINSMDGFYDGPPNVSNVVVVSHGGAAKTTVPIPFAPDIYYFDTTYKLGANASCPVGVSPNP